ncbi:MAG: ATP-binding protein [Chitinophagaceae bacterium]
MKLNRLLNKQVLKYLPAGFIESEEGRQFIEAVNSSYNAYERDIELLNHAFRINEEEYIDINQKLKEEINLKQVSISRLKESVHSISIITDADTTDNSSDELLDIVNYLDNQINQRKQAEESLRIREEKYRNITANMRLGLLEVDNDELITFANQSFCDMSGYTLEELMGQRASDLFADNEQAVLLQQKNELRKQGHSDAYEITLHNKQGDLKWWLISGAPHYNDKGELIGSIGIHLDITKQKKLEKDLMEAKLQAEKSAQAKEIFLANMSHEIRTPMNAILGMSQQLNKTTLNSRQSLFLDAIHNSAEHLLVIINDILDISKIEAGKLNLEHIGFNIDSLVKGAVQVMQHKAEEKGLVLDTIIDEHIYQVLLGDPHRFKQVLLNMMSNSIKFTEKGAIRITCKLKAQTHDSQLLQVTITDTGIGMDEHFMSQLFTKFSQEDDSVARKYGGTGLGMSICKKLIELMNGSIEVTSVKNCGTSISFTLPFVKGQEADLPEKENLSFDSSLLKGCRILLVEDNEMNRLVATTVLSHYEINFKEAVNGEEAVKLLQQEQFDLVLMDVQMPIMNGLEATRIIREQISKTLPIIALTANAIKGESDKCIEAGMNAYVSKPFEEAQLVRTIGSLLGKEIKTNSEKQPTQPAEDKLFDLELLHKLSHGDEKFVTKVISLFIKTAPVSLSEMKKALHCKDFAKIKSVAHSMKPSIDSLGIASMKTKIREIESFPFTETPTENLHKLIEESDEIIASVIVSFQKQFAV